MPSPRQGGRLEALGRERANGFVLRTSVRNAGLGHAAGITNPRCLTSLSLVLHVTTEAGSGRAALGSGSPPGVAVES